MKAVALILLGSLALTSCSSSAPPRDGAVVPRPAVVPVVVAPSAPVISVTGLNPPKGFALDGDLAEWASLDAPAVAPPVPLADRWSREPKPRKDITQGPNPRGARSKVALAIRPDAVLLAATLDRAAADGIWLGIGSLVPQLAGIGLLSRAGMTHEMSCEREQIYLFEGQWRDGELLPPEAAAACRALLARHEALAREHRARFARLFRLDRTRIQAVRGDALVPVEGAVVKAVDREDGATLEVSMPLAALPRMSDAPVGSLRMIARPATQPVPADSETAPWVWVSLPLGVAFEPHADLRAEAFRLAGTHTFFSPAPSYHPATPESIETIAYPGPQIRDRLETRAPPLYEAKKTWGDIEIGLLHAYTPWLVVRKRGAAPKIVELEDLASTDLSPPPALEALIERNGEVHALFFSPDPTNGVGQSPRWYVVGITADGAVRTDLIDSSDVPFQWIEVEKLTSPDFSVFGLRGITHFVDGVPADPAVGYEIALRWSDRERKYVQTRRRIAVSTRGPRTLPPPRGATSGRAPTAPPPHAGPKEAR